MSLFHTLKVKDVRRETEDTVSVEFDVPFALKEVFQFKHGQYLTLRREIKGEDVRRSYSICSGVDDASLRVAVKKVEGGLFSTYANEELNVNDELEVMEPNGNFTCDLDANNEKHYVLFAAGSGITPMMSIIKTILIKEPKSEITLIYGNRYFNTIVFRDELEDLKDAYLGRLRVFHILSGEVNEIELFAGRINAEKVERLFATFLDVDNCDEVFICGPEPMINEVSGELKNLGLAENKIHFELFTSPLGSLVKAEKPKVSKELKGKTCRAEITLYGQQWDLDIPFDQPILDSATEKGLDLPFSCKGGMCCTCRAKLNSGDADMVVNYALEPGEVDAGYVLTCQTYPKSEKISVSFDD